MRRLLLVTVLTLPSLAFAQGALTPPSGAFSGAAPAPTMKTLDQLEPRTPLEPGAPGVSPSMNGGLIIDEPGSYYLTGNLTVSSGNAIDIGASNVTLDLNGFTILSTAGDNVVRGAGIELSGSVTNVTIRNGHIRGGFDHGITAPDSSTSNLADNVSVVGVMLNGINLPNGSTVTHCSASRCGGTGITATVVGDSVAEECSFMGINAKTAANSVGKGQYTGLHAESASNCRGEATSLGYGLYAAVSATNCYGLSVDGPGLTCGLALNCRGDSTTNIGLEATTATGCRGRTTTGHYGLLASEAAENCCGYIWKNTTTGLAAGTGTGLSAQTATNCHGETSGSGLGLHARTATGCSAESIGNTALQATFNAENCRGIATGLGYGLWCGGNALNCYGETATGNYGLWVNGTANTCRGKNNVSAVAKAVHADVAIGCSSAQGIVEAAQKFLGTP